MKHKKVSSVIRYIFQFGILAAIISFLIFGKKTNPEAYCPFGGLQTLSVYLTKGTLACSMTTVQIMLGAALALCVILLGKLFCSYLCPLGTLGELMLRLRRALKIRKFSIKYRSPLDLVLRSIKYILLFIIFYMTISNSELFCKNFDPYYAMATGFKGEITLWMTIISMLLLFLGSLVVDMFWCRYVCPLGAISNLFKFTLWFIALILIFAIFRFAGVDVPWTVLLAAECLAGYLLEILVRRPKLNPQILSVVRDADKCTSCGKCEKRCPYHIDIKDTPRVTAPECHLCGECIKSCPEDALSINKKKWGGYIAPIVVIVLFAIALYLGNATELPTIDFKWNDPAKVPAEQLREFEMAGMSSVKCYKSSMAFKSKLEIIPGVYGVKTFVKHGKVKIYYNPAEVEEDFVRECVYVPVKFKISSPSPDVKEVKMITIRTENMYDRMSPNYLGLQLRLTGKKYYGLASYYADPLIIDLFMDVDEPVDEEFLKEIVEKKVLAMPIRGGKVKETKLDFKFAALEEGEEIIPIRAYLEKIFTPFKSEFKERIAKYENRPQEIVEFVSSNYDKPVVRRFLPYFNNYLFQTDGIIGVYLVLNDENMPAIRVRYCTDEINSDKIWELVSSPKWTINYKDKGIVEENAKIRFTEKGRVIPF